MDEMNEKLLENIKNSIFETVKEKKIGVAFSGGVDSTLISKICSDMNYDITLLTIGFPESHDILFAKEVNEHLKYPHYVLEIDSDTFSDISSKINQTIKTDNLSWNENCIAFYYVSKLANSLGLDTVVTANGVDELFCGYNAYREAFSGGESQINKVMLAKLDNELKMMKAVNSISSEFGVRILQPLLSQKFIEYAKTVPISEKIHDSEDLYRKHIIRKLASEINVPEISCTKRKKALQYGSKIHKALLKTR
ncbi:MAG: asparagine synthase C-terminal domain-containing protein [Nitrosopumilus sp.]|nr:asparagine synthase C-terminal domain-containing protein [Nitrosopumilus sp.]MDF2425654.1 asparagine synthase C-terminal domain-containing protein [Nitrosopumilus sp.]MDF2427011.1 asparagine synthase C-terminal domain-containing protein [Nitrosopumilus sp.]MDF2428875.1 asparagine synthase C-terminal domain-containing protein [Nitrosopumilus sp.]MDF2429810.1 asparagine synthase C-terminal domain-containing protein [Nitrosopumilus sp.]